MHQPIFAPEVISAKTKGYNVKSLSFFTKKRTKYTFQISHAIILCLRYETDIQTRSNIWPAKYLVYDKLLRDRNKLRNENQELL